MQTVIVLVDDTAHAQQQLPRSPDAAPVHWVLVACAPRMTHRASKWVSHSARENWRSKWAERLFGELAPPLQAAGDRVSCVLARVPLPELTRQLTQEHPGARVLDLRRPRAAPQAPGPGASSGLLGLGAALLLLAD